MKNYHYALFAFLCLVAGLVSIFFFAIPLAIGFFVAAIGFMAFAPDYDKHVEEYARRQDEKKSSDSEDNTSFILNVIGIFFLFTGLFWVSLIFFAFAYAARQGSQVSDDG